MTHVYLCIEYFIIFVTTVCKVFIKIKKMHWYEHITYHTYTRQPCGCSSLIRVNMNYTAQGKPHFEFINENPLL